MTEIKRKNIEDGNLDKAIKLIKKVSYTTARLERYSNVTLVITRETINYIKSQPTREVIGSLSFPMSSTTIQEVEEWEKMLNLLRLELPI